MGNKNLIAAKNTKNDEFYTRYGDIEAEMSAYVEYNPDVFRGKTILLPCDDYEWSNFTKYFAANFQRFGLKKLISTSYAKGASNAQVSLFEQESPLYDKQKHETHGKLFTLSKDNSRFAGYLEGDGDFRSAEVTKLRDEADIIITNPPFSLFREFLAWIMVGKKQFAIIGNKNAVIDKEVFPLLKNNQMWIGNFVPAEFVLPDGTATKKVQGLTRWFTNIDHGGRPEQLQLMTMSENLKDNEKLKKKLAKYGVSEYPHYDNYDAIEVPYTECIPSDYDGMMGVPITFLDKYDPEQFEILGITKRSDDPYRLFKYAREQYANANDLNAVAAIRVEGIPRPIYPRILIRHKH